MTEDLKKQALAYHTNPVPGKIKITSTKPLATRHDLSLAYSPGVAYVCEEIRDNPEDAYRYTAKSNLVGVISNGTAVLGLGDIGALASKPVMEGKGVLFKKFADIDVFDLEVNEKDPQKLIDVVASLEPTFGGINLEDIKAPECFDVEDELVKRLNIPVFHDDQHGTAIIVLAGLKNALKVAGKAIEDIRIVTSGAGAAAIACLDLLVEAGVKISNITCTDKDGILHENRTGLHDRQMRYAKKDQGQNLETLLNGADVFLGLSVGGILKPNYLKTMAKSPIVFALANPNPEILPDDAKAVRDDVIMATGRSDYPNQVNNVLCFPFLFRGALDVAAKEINTQMKLAAAEALSQITFKESSEEVALAYNDENFVFGPNYLIPKPFDPRLLTEVAPAVAEAAMKSGAARKDINLKAYREELGEKVYRSGLIMRSVFEHAAHDLKRIAYADGEDERVLRAVQQVVDQNLARPILIGRPEVIEQRIQRFGLRLKIHEDFEVTNPEQDERYNEYRDLYYELMCRKGVTFPMASTVVRTDSTTIAALMVKRGEADAMLCGAQGNYVKHLNATQDVLGLREGVHTAAAMNVLMTEASTLFIADTYVNERPNPEQLCEIVMMAASTVRKFGLVPKVALVSHSNFGSRKTPSAYNLQETLKLLRARCPDLEVDGEMTADAALSQEVRDRLFKNSTLKGEANLLVMPGVEAANATLNTLKGLGSALSIGPILLGMNGRAHLLTALSSVRGIVNMSALAAVDAGGGIASEDLREEAYAS